LNSVKLLVGPLAALLAVAAAGCGGSGSSSAATASGGGKVNLVAYSTPQPAYEKLIPAFQGAAAGKGTSFTQSYGASGDQSRAVAAGQPADVVHFSLQPDIKRLVDAKLVPSSWDQNQYHGIVANSVVVFVVRKGNPKHITGWDDLVKPGVQVITPNPFTSGGARWNIMAGYGAELKEGKTPAQAEQYLSTLFHHVPVQDDKASAALQTFVGGKGDVLLAYEQDALLAEKAGTPLDIVYPKQTILIQTPLAATTKASAAGKAFAKWMWTPQAQTILGQNGYRPVVPSVASTFTSDYPTPPQLFTIAYVGGWDEVMTKFFDPTHSVMQQIEQSLGVSTSG
jgi:sulfate/thiosulfate transport system substrate-binding protein